jgi:hypothetical protein
MYSCVFKIFMVLWLSFSQSALAQAGQALDVVFTAKPRDENSNFYVETLLEKVLKKGGEANQRIHLVQAKSYLSRKRMLNELVSGKKLQVVAETSSREWEDRLIPIHIPIRKGIHGYRLFLINRQDQAAFSKIKSLDELKNFATGSEIQWSIRKVMETAGFNVITGDTYTTLFDMLKFGRFKSLSRGIDEAFREQEVFSKENTNLVIEENLSLYFPLHTYFYVSPRYPDLAALIENGLKIMIADGSFDRHFAAYYQQDIMSARLWKRRIFKIQNPYLIGEPYSANIATWLDPKLPLVFGYR